MIYYYYGKNIIYTYNIYIYIIYMIYYYYGKKIIYTYI